MKWKTFFFFAYFLQSASLFSSTWNVDANGLWSAAGNWSGGVPNASLAVADFSSIITAPRTITVDGNYTIGTLLFNSGIAYTLTPTGGTLTFDNGGTAALTVASTNGDGAHSVSVPFTLTNPLTVSQGSQGTLTLSGPLTGAALTKSGTGVLLLSGANNHASTTLTAGTLQIPSEAALGAAASIFTVSGGTVQTTGAVSITAHPISLTGGGTFSTPSGNPLTITSAISESGSLTKTGAGVLTLSNAANSYSGGTIINGGTLSISNPGHLGNLSAPLTIGSGATLETTAGITIARTTTLSGSATIDTPGVTLTYSGMITGSGSLTKVGTGTLALTNGSNNYTGGTVVSAGTLSVNSDGCLGTGTGSLSIGAATLVTTMPSSARSITLTGAALINPSGTDLTLSGPIGGGGSLTKIGGSVLTLTGANTYSGGTAVNAGTLQGNTSSLQGSISNASALIFNQTSTGTYSGVLSGAGTFTKIGGGALKMTGDSSSFSGATTLTGGTLLVDGSLQNSSITVNTGAILGGTGIVGSVTCLGGTISPGDSIGTLTINGNLTLDASSTTLIEIAPTSSDRVVVNGAATLDGHLSIAPQPGFYGLSASYTILTSGAPPIMGVYATAASTSSNFIPTVVYLPDGAPSTVVLNISVVQPFFDFPFTNRNTESVGNNFNALAEIGTLQADSDLLQAINALIGASFSTINDALDQMQPSQISAFADMQASLGGEILSIFHRKPLLLCGCSGANRVWIEPFGDWLTQKHKGMQVGFHSFSKGLALGYDTEFGDKWSFGFGGTLYDTHLDWHNDRGFGDTHGLLGALYSDYASDSFYFGASVLAGMDWYEASRKIHYTTIDRHANSSFDGINAMGQLSAAYFFGSPVCHLYPYANLDFLYIRMDGFTETDAGSLSLHVSPYGSLTMRSEAGIGFEVIDKNYHETMCISPLVALGWTMQHPIARDSYSSRFKNQPIDFEVWGWDQTWNLFTARFGLDLTFKCFHLTGEYVIDMSPDGGDPYDNQRGNLRFSWYW